MHAETLLVDVVQDSEFHWRVYVFARATGEKYARAYMHNDRFTQKDVAKTLADKVKRVMRINLAYWKVASVAEATDGDILFKA